MSRASDRNVSGHRFNGANPSADRPPASSRTPYGPRWGRSVVAGTVWGSEPMARSGATGPAARESVGTAVFDLRHFEQTSHSRIGRAFDRIYEGVSHLRESHQTQSSSAGAQ